MAGKQEGSGRWTLPNGFQYDGQWKAGKFAGHGVATWFSGEKYDGEWQAGQQTGHGIWTLPNGEKYDGEWKEDRREGHGVYTWPTGEKYDGEWRAGQQNGHGAQTLPDGTVLTGEWKANEFMGAPPQAPEKKAGSAPTRHEARMGVVNVLSDVAGAEIFIDGRLMGKTPVKINLRGLHTLTATKAGYREYIQPLQVDDGSEMTLHLELEPY